MRVASRREFEASHDLETAGWFTLTPIKTEIKLAKPMRGGKTYPRKAVIRPQIPGIVFAGWRGVPPWLLLDDVKHVYGPLGISGRPIPLPLAQVERFRTEASRVIKPSVIKAGAKARITNGPFAGHEIDILKIKGRAATVIQSWFGGAREVQMMIENLEAVETKQ